ncbi:MAG: acetylornithine aminotransferase [Candelina submexicana]|nr:MAG: acetylornithine aminotransferase [Candelina submexicana]
MALRMSPRCLHLSSKARSVAAVGLMPNRRSASTAPAQASNLPQATMDDIHREASLPNADPSAESATAGLVNGHVPYMVATYVRPPPMFEKGEGCYLWDVENRRYLDFTAGIAVNALGHCDPGMSNLLAQQGRTLIHTSNLYHNPWTGELSKLMIDKTRASGSMQAASKAFICNSGSEANEAALKFARKVGKVLDPSGHKHEILSFHNSFHGRTMGSLSATPNPKYQAPFSPILPGFKYGHFNDIASLSSLITKNTCGVIIEPIQGEGGVNVATPQFLQALRTHCNNVGAVLIFDEIQCGLSRTGTLWAHQHLPESAHPDILTTAKALGNGFPVGATLVNEDVAQKIVTGDHGTTFGGNPLACRLAHYCFSRLSDPELQAGVLTKEKVFRRHFDKLRHRFPNIVKEVRGRGLILGLQLGRDPAPLVTAARERGLLVITCGKDTLRFVPPLIISENEIEEGMGVLQEAMRVVFEEGEKIRGTDSSGDAQEPRRGMVS